MKKLFWVPLMIGLTLAMVFVGCAAPAPTSVPPAPTTASPAPTLAPKPAGVIELKFAHHAGPQSTTQKLFEKWRDKVESQTGGRIKVTFYPASSLVQPADAWSATIKGVCDMELSVTSFHASRLLLTSVTDQPALNWPTVDPVPYVFNKLYEKFPEIRAEFKDVKLLFPGGTPGHWMHHSKKVIRLPEEIKGMKLSAEMPWSKIIEAIGASPVALGPPDWYTALERGLIEGIILPNVVLYSHKVYPLVPYHSLPGPGHNISTQVIMNLDKWNSLPPDIQKIIDEIDVWAGPQYTKDLKEESVNVIAAMKGTGHTVVELTPAELAKWQPYFTPQANSWIAEREAKGLPAKAVFEEALRLIKEYK